MEQQILRKISHRLRKSHTFSVQRVAVSEAQDESSTARFSSHVNAVLKGLTTEIRGEAARAHDSSHIREGLIAYGGIGTKSQFEKHALERFTSDAARQKLNFDYTVHSGCRAYAPPYDREYQVGIAEAFGATADGNVLTLAPYDGQSAAGIGFYLTTDEPVLASITPQGTYQWSWFNLQNVLPNVWTTGGTGITIYANADTEPTLSRQQVLWSESGLTPWSGQTGNGNIADAASPAFGFGSIPLGPALLNMAPGSRYLVWIWCWQLAHSEESDGFLAMLSFTMPSVTVCVGPQISIH
jgi:hypothetical protein